jgi:hypothetical protein
MPRRTVEPHPSIQGFATPESGEGCAARDLPPKGTVSPPSRGRRTTTPVLWFPITPLRRRHDAVFIQNSPDSRAADLVTEQVHGFSPTFRDECRLLAHCDARHPQLDFSLLERQVVDADLRGAVIALQHGDTVFAMEDHASTRHQMLLGFLVAIVEGFLELTKQIRRGATRMIACRLVALGLGSTRREQSDERQSGRSSHVFLPRLAAALRGVTGIVARGRQETPEPAAPGASPMSSEPPEKGLVAERIERETTLPQLVMFALLASRVAFAGDSRWTRGNTRRAVHITDQRAPSHSGAEIIWPIANVVD